MEKLPLSSKNVATIYMLANSASSLYSMMRSDYSVQNELAVLPTKTLIDEFNKRIGVPIDTNEGIAEVYAILIALTFKKRSEVEAFFKEVTKIKFEWFSNIANYYLNNEQEIFVQTFPIHSGPTPIGGFGTTEITVS